MDITMCNSKICPLREECYRYTAKPNEYMQSYFIEPPFNKEEQTCECFLKI